MTTSDLKILVVGAIVLCTMLSGCCIPIMGPCLQNEYAQLGASKNTAAVLETADREQEPFGRGFVWAIMSQDLVQSEQREPIYAKTVYLLPGTDRFTAFGLWNRPPIKMGPVPVVCYKPLGAGHYNLRAVRRFDERGMAWFQMIVQKQGSETIDCLSSPGAPIPVPDWVQQALKNETTASRK